MLLIITYNLNSVHKKIHCDIISYKRRRLILKTNKILLVICFLLPIVGIIYYFVKKEDPNRKTYLIVSLISIVLLSFLKNF